MTICHLWDGWGIYTFTKFLCVLRNTWMLLFTVFRYIWINTKSIYYHNFINGPSFLEERFEITLIQFTGTTATFFVKSRFFVSRRGWNTNYQAKYTQISVSPPWTPSNYHAQPNDSYYEGRRAEGNTCFSQTHLTIWLIW